MASLLLYVCSPAPKATPASTAEIVKHLHDSNAPLLLIHVWATWCDPCREEFPELVKIQAAFAKQGLSIMLVSADDPKDAGIVKSFLLEQKSPMDSFIATQLNEAFIESLSPTWSGALPASFFFGASGNRLAEWEGKQSYAHYAKTIETLLKQIKGDTP